ncbi:MAG: immunity 49 family protein [Myxococcota bacterium]|nr:immunity 49 family protein [Myxococcota bacterium]
MKSIAITAHVIRGEPATDELVAGYVSKIARIPHEVARGLPAQGNYIKFFIIGASFALHRGETDLGRRLLSVALDCAAASFMSSGRAGEFTFCLEGRPLTGPGGDSDVASLSRWTESFLLASALRRIDVLDVLAAYTHEDLRRSTTGTSDEYTWTLAEALRLYHLRDPSAAHALAEAEVQSRPENLRVAPPRYASRYRALIPIYQAVSAHDQAAFTTACAEAIRAHKAFYSRGQEVRGVTGILAYQAAGAAAQGIDRGLAWEIESPYTPDWLVLRGRP